MTTPPPILYDGDGVPMGVHGHIKPIRALDEILNEQEWLADDYDLRVYSEDRDDYRLSHVRVREVIEEFTHGWMIRNRYAPTSKPFLFDSFEWEGDFGDDTWWRVPDTWPLAQVIGAEPYTLTNWN